jgi:RHS repeat-associated protein
LASSETWKYDALGRIISRTDDFDTFDYTYNGATRRVGKIQSSQGFVIGASYYPPTGDGLMRTLSYGIVDHRGLLPGPSIEALAGFEYQYDANHNVKSFTEYYPDHPGAPTSTSYSYDTLNQLSVIQGPGALFGDKTTYTYDLAGNLTEANSVGSGTGAALRSRSTNTSYGAANGILTTKTVDFVGALEHSVAGAGVYNSTGGLLTLGASPNWPQYQYDALDRLIGVTQQLAGQPEQQTVLGYDGLGRISHVADKGVSNSDYYYLYCGSIRCARVCPYEQLVHPRPSPCFDGTNVESRIYLPEGYETYNTSDPGPQKRTFAWYIKDQLGSVRRVWANGAFSADYQFDPFGNRTKISGTGPDSDVGLAGYFYHAPTGLQFAMHRVYNAQLGRWLTRDPIGYGFAFASPSSWPGPGRGFGPVTADYQFGGTGPERWLTRDPIGYGFAFASPLSFNATDLNLYAYVRNNPTSWRDPLGLGDDSEVCLSGCLDLRALPPVTIVGLCATAVKLSAEFAQATLLSLDSCLLTCEALHYRLPTPPLELQ